ncbi:MAG: ABC transporter substrate-binding protein [Proteobacteria bacterium]|nr:ABC transporter substrate-binding protein [Pseudomonadota bacterium]
MKNLLVAVISLLLFYQSAAADDKSEVEKLLKNNLDTVITVLQKKDLEQQAKNKEIVDIVTPMFDFELMARLSLGKKHWPGLSQDKKERFTELFIKRLKASYLNNFTLYTDEKVFYEPSVQVKKKIHTPTYLVSKDKKISILYKFYKAEKNWKIYDLEIQGVSIIRSYRSQFSSILESGTVDDLLLKLENPADN